METPRRIAEIRDFDHLQAVLRDVADQREMSRNTIDDVAGWASGYASKVLAPIPMKALGPQTIPKLLRALGVRLVLEDDPIALADLGDLLGGRSSEKMNTCKASMKEITRAHINKVAARLDRRRVFQRVSLGGKARASKLTPFRRRQIAKIAADALWKKIRAARKARILEEREKPR